MERDLMVPAALEAIGGRGHFSAFAESPSPRVYGADAAGEGASAFAGLQGESFDVDSPGADGRVTTEASPFGIRLDVAYPRLTAAGLDAAMAAATAGMPAWRDAGPDRRLEVCLAILDGLHQRIFELAHAVHATTGQGFVMAFQAGGAHALDRALEALTLAHAEMTRWPATATWEKPTKGEPLRIDKTFTVVPRGVAVVIGCSTFPTWNSYPGLFASLVTGNPVVVKPHPHTVLPLAITVQACQRALTDHGFDPHLVQLAAEQPGDELAKDLVTRPEVRVVDYTGGSAFGDWVDQHAGQAVVFAEKSGVNPVVIDGTDAFDGMCTNLAFTLSLYSGQMCTTTQCLFIPEGGIQTDSGRRTFDQVAAGIAEAIEALLASPERAVELLGGIVDDRVLARLESAAECGEQVLASRRLDHPNYPDATVRTPALVAMGEGDIEVYGRECFGPVTYLVRTADSARSLDLVRRTITEAGAMTFGVHSTDADVLAGARSVALDCGVALSENLTGGVYVNQSAAYTDFHGTGLNPAATAAFTDAAFVTPRFGVVQFRRASQIRRHSEATTKAGGG